MRSLNHSLVGIATTCAFAAIGCANTSAASYAVLTRDYHAVADRLEYGRSRAAAALRARTLERTALIRAVLAYNPDLESARQAFRAALARYRQSGAYEDPMLMGAIAPLSIGAAHARVGYELGISQRIPLGGKLSSQAELAAAEANATACDYRQARLKLGLMASQLYDDYASALRSLEIQAQHAELVNALRENLVAAYASGHAAAQDSLLAEAELARIEFQKLEYESQRDVAVAQLNALLHRDVAAPLPVPAPELPRDAAEPESAAQQSKRLAQRPDVAAAQARVVVARARRAAADSEYYPDLTLSASYNSMWDMPEHRLMLGIAINLPLQRSRREGSVAEASAMQAAASSDVQSIADAARSEVAVARTRVVAAERAVQLYEQRVIPIARQRIEVVRSGLVTAQSSVMTAIEAERELRSAELALQLARADLNKRRAELSRALGRIPGIDANEDAP